MGTGVIFDMDGVLVASGPAHRASWRAIARKHRIDISDGVFLDSFGRPSRDIVRQIWGADTPDEAVHAIDEEKEALYRDLISGMVPLMIGARETLTNLSRAGFALAVATSGPPANVDLVFRETGIGQFFQSAINGMDVQRGKPAPDIFLAAADAIEIPPSACVVIEDAPVGIDAARAAGMRVIGLVGTHPAAVLHAAGATLVADRLSDATPDVVRALLE